MILSTVAGAITTFLPLVINLAEKLIPKRPDGAKTGTEKMDMVIQITRAVAEKLAAINGVHNSGVADPELQAMIELKLAEMKTNGLLGADLASGQLYLVRGHIQPLNLS